MRAASSPVAVPRKQIFGVPAAPDSSAARSNTGPAFQSNRSRPRESKPMDVAMIVGWAAGISVTIGARVGRYARHPTIDGVKRDLIAPGQR